jgi:hypothetical protein
LILVPLEKDKYNKWDFSKINEFLNKEEKIEEYIKKLIED